VFDAEVVVVGGGPAGLFLAARLASALGEGAAPRVLLAEKGPRPGRKLLASGSGQCNITHAGPVDSFLGRYGGAGRFLRKALYAFSNADLEAWFLERGLAFVAEEDGKVFPSTRRAGDVLSLLLAECRRSGVAIRADCRVVAAARVEGGFSLEASSAGGAAALRSRFLALATGGASYPATGSTGDGYAIAASLGHGLVPPRPSLSPVSIRGFALGELAGISFADAPFALRRSGKVAWRRRGDILITREGLSGPGILDASRELAAGDAIELDFSALGAERLAEVFAARVASAPRSLVRNALASSGLPSRLAEKLCALAGIEGDLPCSRLKKSGRDEVLRLATAFPVVIDRVAGFDRAMATAGGVPLDEVDPATMESRIAPGLYFSGELLDLDGDSGGFNMQAAFSTAAAAARAMAERLGPGILAR
jgi:predicted Rossmann fold flavoprotein